MDVGKKYLKVLHLSFKTKNAFEDASKNYVFIKNTEMSLDKLFYEVIDSKNAKFDDMVALAQAYLYVSHVISERKKVLYDTEIHLTKCLELLNGEELNQKAILIVISALNELAKLAYVQKNVRKSKSFLNYALQQCVKYKNEKEGYLEPIYIPRILGIEHEENAHLLDKLHLYIVTYLQEMYYVNQDDSIMRILYNSVEGTWSTQMEISRESEFLKVLKSSFRSVNINPIIELSDRKKKFIAVIEARMDKLFHDVIKSHDVKLDEMVILARAYLYMSTIYSTKNQKGDLQKCESHLTKCTMLLKEKELDSKSILIAIRTFHELACVKLKLEEPEKSKSFLHDARRLYLAYTKGSDEYPDVMDVAMILGIEYNENCKTLLDSANILNLACFKMLPNKKLFISEDLQNDISKWIYAVEKVKRIEDVKIEMVCERFVEIFRSSREIRNTYLSRKNVDKKTTIENVDDERIKEITEKMNKLFSSAGTYNKCSTVTNFNENIILAHAYFYIYHTLFMKGEEIDNRIECLTKCVKLLNGRELDPKAILIAMDALNQSAKIYMSVNEMDKAKSNTEKVIQLYVTYTKEMNYPTPINIADIVNLKCKLQSDETLHALFIDSLHTFDNLIKTIKSGQTAMYSTIVCMHKSLNEKLNFLELIQNSNIYFILFLQAITLTRYFTLHKQFIEIKNYLGIACYLWQKFFTETCIKGKQRFYNDKIYRYTNVTIKKFLIDYGIYLLRMSRAKSSQNKQSANEEGDRLREASSSKVQSATTSEEQCRELLVFTDIEKYMEPFTSAILDKYISNYKDAEKVTMTVMKLLQELRVNCNPTDLVMNQSVILISAHVCRYFVKYMPDENERINLIEGYIESFEKIINTMSSNTKDDETHAKYIWLLLGIAYTTILDIKTNSLQMTSKVPEERSMDIVQLVKSSTQNFQLFLDSFKDNT